MGGLFLTAVHGGTWHGLAPVPASVGKAVATAYLTCLKYSHDGHCGLALAK